MVIVSHCFYVALVFMSLRMAIVCGAIDLGVSKTVFTPIKFHKGRLYRRAVEFECI